MDEIARVKRNIGKMIEQGAPEEDIDAYVASEGISLDDLRGEASPDRQERPSSPEGDMSVGNAVRATARGVPVVGGFLDEMNAATNAALDPLVPTAVAEALGLEKIPGETFSERYENELTRQRGRDQAFDEENPITSTALQIGGGVGAGGALLKAAPAAARAVLGLGGASLPGKVAAGAASGGVLSALHGFGEGEEGLENRLEEGAKGLLFGTGVGGAVPVLAQGVGAAARGLFNAAGPPLPGSTRRASRLLAENIDPQSAAQVSALGPEAMLLDAGPSALGLAQGVVTRPGAGRDTLVEALKRRKQGANARLRADVDEAVGPAPIPSRIERQLAEGRNLTAEAYGPVMAEANAVDTQALAHRLEEAAVNLRGPAQRAVQQVRQMLDIPGNPGTLDPNPQALLNTRQAIDGLLTTETNPQVIRQLTMARQEVDAAMAAAAPGIKAVDARYAELARQSEGLQRGSQVLDSGKTAVRPEELAEELQRGVTPQGQLIGPSAQSYRLRQGARAEIDRQVGTKANDLVALRNVVKGEGDWNRAKLAQIFGEREADRIINAVDREAAFEDAYRKIVENSQTAQRQGAAELLQEEAPQKVDISMSIPGMIARGGQMLGRAFMGDRAARRADSLADELAPVLTAQGSRRDRLIGALMRAQENRSANAARGDRLEALVRALLQGSTATEANQIAGGL